VSSEKPTVSELARFLAHNNATCPACHYQLRGTNSPNCPECGAELALGVVQPPRPLGAWTLMVVPFAMGLGFDAVVASVMLVPSILSGQFFYSIGPILMLAFGAASCAGAIYALFRHQRLWFGLTQKAQRRWVIGAFAGVFVAHLGLGGLIFGLMI
jgi:hypothetical protein